MDGILNIDKPWGKTSFTIVAMVKRLIGERRVGHAGTLDPDATGVLPVCFGQGTRIIEFLLDTTKTYRAQIELGVATDTYDASGKVTQKGDASHISQDQLKAALTTFHGLIQQTPPMYSALKHHGRPLYELARAGIEIERESRPIQIFYLELTEWQPPIATVEIECSKGTYIRSLAHDLGQLLACGAHLKSLIRLRYGPFDIKDTVSITQLDEAFRYGHWQQFVYPIDTVLSHWSAIVVDDITKDLIRKGISFTLPNDTSAIGQDEKYSPAQPSIENRYRAYTVDGHFLSVLRFNPEKGNWQPEKVFL